jgi:hypothetical protein
MELEPFSSGVDAFSITFESQIFLGTEEWGAPTLDSPSNLLFRKWGAHILSINPVTYTQASDFCVSLFGYIFPVSIFHSSSDLLNNF